MDITLNSLTVSPAAQVLSSKKTDIGLINRINPAMIPYSKNKYS